MFLSMTALSGCTAKEENILRIAAQSDILTMDVALTTNDYFIPQNCFDRLFEIEVQPDGSTEIVPSVVTSYSVSDDGLTYSFRLRDDVTFSNGNALKADDVKYTFERLLTVANGVNYDIALEIVGAQELHDGKAEELTGITVTGDYELTVTLSAPNAGFIAELTAPAMSLVDRETCESAANFGMDPSDTIGSGPYIVSEWVANDHYTLVRNDNYWGKIPSAARVIVNIVPDPNTQNLMFQNGELDIIDLDSLDAAIISDTYKTKYANSIVTARRVGITYLALNEANEYLSDVKVRKAVQMAINRENILTNLYDGEGILENGIIAHGVWGHNDSLPEISYDPDAAKALLAEAGYGEGEISFELALDSSSSSTVEILYQQIQQDLAAAGITAKIRSYDSSAWLDLRRSGKMDAFIATWTMDYNDPANIMVTFFGNAENAKGRSLNYYDVDIMARVSAASSIVDDDKRMAEYQVLEEKIIVGDAAWVPLFERTHLFAIGEKVASFVPHWAGYSNFFARDVVMK